MATWQMYHTGLQRTVVIVGGRGRFHPTAFGSPRFSSLQAAPVSFSSISGAAFVVRLLL
jgi:hypothetical protein